MFIYLQQVSTQGGYYIPRKVPLIPQTEVLRRINVINATRRLYSIQTAFPILAFCSRANPKNIYRKRVITKAKN
jgi:hypothetical protein